MSSADALDHDGLIAELSNLTSIPPPEARQYLEANNWDLSAAATEYYTSLEDLETQEDLSSSDHNQAEETQAALSGPRTLGGDPAPQVIPTTSDMPVAPSSSSNQPHKKKFATLGDLGGGAPSSSHAGHDHGDDGGESDEENQDLFAGGEKSGLAVHNPEDLKRKILERAKRTASRGRPGGDEPQAPSSRFTGTARTLGGDDTPSRVIEDPNASTPASRRPAPVERRLIFWRDGFSIDDGPLYRNDDPANADILAMIRQGRAPLDIMNVEHTQEVDVKLEQRDENWIQLQRPYKPFSGGGQRLGSPTPGPAISSTSTAPTISIDTATASTESPSPIVDVDNSQPILSLQIRLGDGTRLVSRFNTTHTIGEVYDFINASSPASRGRPWVLMTTFPNKEFDDKSQILGDLSEFKRGGVVLQKWK